MPGKKRARDYIMPFFIIILIVAVIGVGWNTISKALTKDFTNNLTDKVFLNIESGSAKAMMANKGEWKNAPNNIDLYSGERLKTGADGRVTLTFSGKSIVRLDKNTEVELLRLSRKEDTMMNEIWLEKGDIWGKIERMTNPDSHFSINTSLLTIDTRGGDIAVHAPGTVYVLSGTAQVGVKYDDEVIKTVSVGVGQQFMIDEQIAIDISEDINHELIFALSDSFRSSNWYRWNMNKDGAIEAFEESGTESGDIENEADENDGTDEGETGASAAPVNVDRLISVSRPSQKSSTSKSSVSVEGMLDPEKIKAVYVKGKKATVSGSKWSVSQITLTQEGENTITIEAEDLSGNKESVDPLIIIYDKTPPSAPVITDPVLAEGKDSVEINNIEQIISGTVSSDTHAVIVNDYRLGKYVPGSKEFEYYAKIAYGNLKAGENEYLVYAEDKAGNQSAPAKIVLSLDQSVIDEAGVTEESESDDTDTTSATEKTESQASEKTIVHEPVPAATSSGGVKITSPNSGESFTTSETEFDIQGEVPAETEKVIVNDYTLSLYEAGDTTFTYKARSSFDNLIIGQKNTYTATAYDADGNSLGSASITIDVESGLAAAPVITMPAGTGTYSTTLDQIVLGGTVGKWIDKVYINSEFISDYIPGSGEWKKTVTLSPGENVFKITGEQDGEKTQSAVITIEYQN